MHIVHLDTIGMVYNFQFEIQVKKQKAFWSVVIEF